MNLIRSLFLALVLLCAIGEPAFANPTPLTTTLTAPSPGQTFSNMPSGTTYKADTSGNVAGVLASDVPAMLRAGCTAQSGGGGGGGAPTGTAGGDLSGNYPNPTVTGSNGTAFGSAAFQPTSAFDATGAAAAAKAYFTAISGILNCNGSGCVATNSSALQTAIGSGVYDASGAAATATSTAAQKANNLSDLASALTARTNLGAATALRSIYELVAAGDSYISGYGATDIYTKGVAALASLDTPAPYSNFAVGGTTAATITNSVFLNFDGGSPSTPSVIIINGGENDGTTCTGAPTSQCGISFGNLYRAADSWLAIPAANKILASAAAPTGTWTNPGDLYQPTLTASNGTSLASTVSGSTLTFNIPSSSATKVGVTYRVTAAGTGTFTGTLDATLVTDDCSASTTFTSTGCGANPTITAPGSFYRQEYTVTPNQAHQLVVATTNASSSEIVGVDWNAPNANANAVFHVGVNAAWGNYLNWNSVTTPLLASLRADGWSTFYVDPVNGTPGLNATSDLSATATATCPATTYGSHPNDCGHLHLWQTIQAAEAANNWVFSQPGGGGKSPAFTGQLNAPFVITNSNAPSGAGGLTPTHATGWSSLGGVLPGGVDLYRGNSTYGSVGAWTDTSTGKPWSGQNVIGFNQSNGAFWNCFASYNISFATNAAYTDRSCFDTSGVLYLPEVDTLPTTIAASTAPALVATSGLQTITLPAATSVVPTISGIIAGQRITFEICQPATGGVSTWTWPAAVHGGMTIGTTAGACSVQSFDSISGSTLVAENVGVQNVAP